MTKQRMNISIALMLLAILAIAGFQLYWLVNTYREQEQNLEFRSNVVFREAMYQLQSEKLKLDSNVEFHVMPRMRASRTADDHEPPPEELTRRRRLDMLMRRNWHRAGDSAHQRRRGHSVFFKTDERLNSDSPDSVNIIYTDSAIPAMPIIRGTVRSVASTTLVEKGEAGPKDTEGKWLPVKRMLARGMPDQKFISLFKQLDSLQDSITVKEATARYHTALARDDLDIPFTVHRLEGGEEEFEIPEDFGSNMVSLGFKHPYNLQLELNGTIPYLLQKMAAQLLVSLLLVGVTIISFVMLFRNLVKQRKLTQLKNDLISNITHELKTPIATVRVAIEALKNFNALHDPKRTQEYLDISENELQRLSLLVDRVLKLSMFEKHQIELKEEAFDLQQLIREVVGSMRLQFEKYHALVTVHTKGDDFLIKADRMHITSVIFNLLDNALKYSQTDPVIRVELVEYDNNIEVSVRDNGIGIAPEYQKKIFEKFFRVPSGNTHNVKGYGLGLSYVAYVVQHHQGQIAVESEPGAGSRFIIKFARTL